MSLSITFALFLTIPSIFLIENKIIDCIYLINTFETLLNIEIKLFYLKCEINLLYLNILDLG